MGKDIKDIKDTKDTKDTGAFCYKASLCRLKEDILPAFWRGTSCDITT